MSRGNRVLSTDLIANAECHSWRGDDADVPIAVIGAIEGGDASIAANRVRCEKYRVERSDVDLLRDIDPVPPSVSVLELPLEVCQDICGEAGPLQMKADLIERIIGRTRLRPPIHRAHNEMVVIPQ